MSTINNATNSQVTQYNTITGGANNTLNNVSPGTSGWVLTSNGAAAQPTYQAGGSAGPNGFARDWVSYSYMGGL